jgi:hypothetical protein
LSRSNPSCVRMTSFTADAPLLYEKSAAQRRRRGREW